MVEDDEKVFCYQVRSRMEKGKIEVIAVEEEMVNEE